MLKIAAYANGGLEVASSRLRSYYLFEEVNPKLIKVFRDLSFIRSLSCNCLHLHTLYTPTFVFRAAIFRILGKKVFFDIVDQAEKTKHKIAIFAMLQIATHVTVSTELTKLFYEKQVIKKKVYLIEDILDVAPSRKRKFLDRVNNSNKDIFYIGHKDTLPSIEALLKLHSLKNTRTFTVITNLRNKDKWEKRYPSVNFIDWEIDIFYRRDISGSYTVLNHDFSYHFEAKYKSENKMILALATGAIPFVSKTPSYQKVAEDIGAEELIFQNIEDIYQKIDNLDPRREIEIIKRSKKYIEHKYLNSVVLAKFMKIIESK